MAWAGEWAVEWVAVSAAALVAALAMRPESVREEALVEEKGSAAAHWMGEGWAMGRASRRVQGWVHVLVAALAVG
jgi:hypothetical protein